MQRITISVSEGFNAELDSISLSRGYRTRSEAVRDLVRDGIERWREEHVEAKQCIANLSYVFDRRVRALPQRLLEMQNAHHDLVAVSTAVRLDHFHTMESVTLKGSTTAVRAFADAVRAERGVRSGALNLLRVEAHDEHGESGSHSHHNHLHLSPIG